MKTTLPTVILAALVALPAQAATERHDFKGAAAAEVYKKASGDDLWIYRFDPAGHDPKNDKRPAVVFFFGGGWNGGTVTQFEQHAKYLAARGMVAFVADYRVKSRQKTAPDASVADGKSAIRWVRKNAGRLGIDPDRIAAGGGSAGGHVAATTGICDGLEDPAEQDSKISSKANGLLLFNPVYDNGPKGYGHDRVKQWFPAISPAHNITKDDPPTIVFLGSNDKLIPVATARKFDADLKAAGVQSEVWIYEGQPHGFFNERKSPKSFLDTVLKMDAFLVALGWLDGQADEAKLKSLLKAPPKASAAGKPNIVYVICDDLGYGDIRCLAPETSKIPTPGADRLASQGMIFTDAHSGSSVCTPTRYGLLTGRYSWRTRLQKGVVTGFAPCLIDEDRPTVASFLKAQGYHTAIVGKWHLDFQYLNPKTGEAYSRKEHKSPPVGAKIPDGPLHRGFDYFHGFHHARNMEAVIENDEVIAHDDVINMLPRLTKTSVEYVDSRAGKDAPFFLYVPLGSPHTPIVPTPQWQGKSGLGAYGDFVMQTDNVVGQISAALERNGQAGNTLVIFTSDNGCSKAAGIDKLAAQGHLVSAHLRGSKADLWDGGHRIPFIVRWPGVVQPGTQCDQLICLTDLFATAGEITGVDLPAGSAEDSVSFLPALSGREIVSSRNGVIHHSISGHFAYRQGPWKLLLARASGGWSSPKESQAAAGSPPAQLYDMTADVGEQKNLYREKPEVARKLLALLEADIERGRSTDGADSQNDVDQIVLWKSGQEAKPDKKQRKKKRDVATDRKQPRLAPGQR